MNPLKVLGAIDDKGQLKEPVCEIGPVTHRGANVMHGNNHTDYVDWWVFYNIVRYLQDFKEDFPAIYHVGVGQFCPKITTEVNWEYLLSQAGFLSEPRQAITVIRMYERLLFLNNSLNQIHFSIPMVKEIFMKRWKDNSW